MVVIRRTSAAEGPELRAIRLAALADAPSAFGSSLEAEERYGDEVWSARAAGEAGSVTFVAVDGAAGWIGLVVGLCPDDLSDATAGDSGRGRGSVELVSMWTAPSHRRCGVAERLVDAVVGWARDDVGAEDVRLWVMRGNEPAKRLYLRCGFEVIDGEASPDDPCADEIRMIRRC